MSRRLVASYLGITLFVLLVLVVPLGVTYAARTEDNLLADIERDARVLATEVEDRLDQGTGPDPAAVVESYARDTGGRAVVVDATGIAIADSDTTQPAGRDFSTRPEIVDALEGRLASGTRPSDTLDTQLMYVAVPVASGGRVLGAVRVTYPRSTLDERVQQNWLRLGVLSVTVLTASAVVGWLIARNVGRPLRDLQAASARVARGDLDARVQESHGPVEVRDLAAAFNAMSARVERMFEHERAFSADVSHQLRTPLTALRLRLESLELDAGPDQREDVEAALREVERLSRLIEALLKLARIGEGRAEPVTVDAAQVVDDRLVMWTPLADEREVRLERRAVAPCPVLALDGALEQVLDNLIANALEVSEPGTTITVAARPLGPEVQVTVTDEGPGMSDADMARAFDRFVTTSGTGLGLAIVQRLATASGGRAELRRAPSGGIEAAVVLPAGALSRSGHASSTPA
jgi:signal transduction histidine kinase